MSNEIENIISHIQPLEDSLKVDEYIEEFKRENKYLKTMNEELKQQKEELIEALSDERDKLYNNLPSGDIKAWDLLIVIKNHISNIDELLRKHTEEERDE